MELRQAENGVFYIHWTEDRRSKRVSTRAKTMAAAKVFLAQWILMEQAAKTGSPMTTAELWEVYYREHAARRTIDPRRLDFVWKNIGPAFGHLRPCEVTQEIVDDYERDRKAGRIGRPSQSSSVWRELVGLKAIWNFAAKRKPRLLDPAEIPTFALPDPPAPRQRWLSVEEIERLFATAEKTRTGDCISRLELFLWLALETGARRRVIETLTWSQVDFETGVIHYGAAAARRSKKRSVPVPISDGLRPVLERAFREKTNDFVLGSDLGVYQIVRTCAKNAGVPKVTPHVLRHTAATHMARAGVPIWKIAGVLGNSVEMVARVYAKHSPDTLKEAVNAIRPARHLRVVK
jgi:integrase